MKDGNAGRAYEYYQKAYEVLPRSRAVQANILSSLIRLGRPFEAVKKATKFGILKGNALVGDDVIHTEEDRLRVKQLTRKADYVSIYGILGVALHNVHQLDTAVLAFKQALLENEKDGTAWVNLGETLLHQHRADHAVWAFENALLVHRVSEDFSPLLMARSWICDWRDYDHLESIVADSFRQGKMKIRSTGDFISVPPRHMLQQNQMLWPPSREIPRLTPRNVKSVIGSRTEELPGPPRLRVGFLSADFGVHPVSSLIRGVVGFLNKSRIDCYLFIWTEERSWWRENITAIAENTFDLFGIGVELAARKIQSLGIDILIDLSGLTLHSGLEILGLRPSPLQISFLGFPMSTGTNFVDYFITDSVAVDPASDRNHFIEHLLFTPPSFFVNDYAQVQSHVMWRKQPSRAEFGLPEDGIVFACFSNFGKIDPAVFDLWMNIMRRVPRGVLWLLRHPEHEEASSNLKMEMHARGISSDRLIFTDFQPWIHHIIVKSCADVVLDTTLKNGHTSSTDALWAGVPVITLLGNRMSTRIASSIISGIDPERLSVVHSLREYEDFAVEYADNAFMRRALDRKIENSRFTESLFRTDIWTETFELQLRALHDMHASVPGDVRMHLYGGPQCLRDSCSANKRNKTILKLYDMPDDPYTAHFYASVNSSERNATDNSIHSPMQTKSGNLLFVYIGGMTEYDAWTLLPYYDVNKETLAPNLTSTVTAIYLAPYVFRLAENFSKESTSILLTDYSRVLRPGGMIFIVLALVDDRLPENILMDLLKRSGFCEIENRGNQPFGLFPDDEQAFHNHFLAKKENGEHHLHPTLAYIRAIRCVGPGEEGQKVMVVIRGSATRVKDLNPK